MHVAVLTPWFQPGDTAFGLLPLRTVWQSIYLLNVVLNHSVCGNFLLQPQGTNTEGNCPRGNMESSMGSRGGRIWFSWESQTEVMAKELGLENETELGTRWCVTKRTVSFRRIISLPWRKIQMSCFQKVTSKGVKRKGKTVEKKTCHASTDCRMVTLELQGLGLSKRELTSVSERERQDLSGSTALCDQVILAPRKGDNKSSRDGAFLSCAPSHWSQAPESPSLELPPQLSKVYCNQL